MIRLFTLRTRIIVAAAALLLLTGAIMTIYINTTMERNLSKELQKRGVAIARNFALMAANPSLTENLLALQLLAIELKKGDEAIEYLFVSDAHDQVLAHTFAEGFPAALAGINPLKDKDTYRIKLIKADHGYIYDIAVPMLKGEVGTAHVGIAADSITEGVKAITWGATALVVGLFILAACGGAVMAASLTRPIEELVAGVEAIGRGDLHYRMATRGDDEISHLKAAFNQMAQSLETTTVSRNYVEQLNRELEQVVDERTEQLSWANSELTKEVAERRQAEEEVRKLNENLAERVRERTSQLEASNRELEAFCYSVSHDLRAPLRHINAYSKMVEDEYAPCLDDVGRHYLQRLAAASRQMGQLIDDLLQLSRVGRAEMQLAEVDLSDIAREIIQELKETQPERTVVVRIEPEMKARGDEVLLRLVLQNLLENSWKYTGPRERAVIEFGRSAEAKDCVFFVRDNGIGFDMAYVDKLFGVFQRLVASDEFTGTGIGLATVERIITRHGGRVWAEGSPDQGATFYFAL